MKYVDVPNIAGTVKNVPVNQLSWRPSAYAIVIHDNKLLTVKYKNGKYDLPGGGIDFGESIEEAVIREVAEETGMKVSNLSLINAKSTYFRFNSDSKNCQTLMLYYRCDFVDGSFSKKGFDDFEIAEMETAEWLALDLLDDIEVISTVDWREIVKTCL